VLSIGGLFTTTSGTAVPTAVLSVFGIYAVVALVGFVVFIYCAVLYKRSFDRLSERSGASTATM
jgi:hypothetical protein